MAETTTETKWQAPKVIGIEIKKIRLTKHHTLYLEYRERYDDNTHSDIKKDCEAVVHIDLVKSLENLIPHLVVLCDQKDIVHAANVITGKFPKLEEELDRLQKIYTITGFTISGDDEKEGYTLCGKKDVDGKTLNLFSPYRRWTEDYDYSNQLEECIDILKAEVTEYLNGKVGVKQLSMAMDDSSPDEPAEENDN